MVCQDNNNKVDKVIEGVLILAVSFYHQLEFSNKNKHELDDEDLERNIGKVAIEGDLSPKQIDTINVAQGRKYKNSKNTCATTIETRSHSKRKSG